MPIGTKGDSKECKVKSGLLQRMIKYVFAGWLRCRGDDWRCRDGRSLKNVSNHNDV